MRRFDADAMLDRVCEQRMPIAEFVRAMGVDPKTFGQWCAGAKQPRRVAVALAAHILECAVDDLYCLE